MVEVSLQAVAEPPLRQRLLALPTTLYLPPERVKQLRENGSRLLRDAPEFQCLLRAIGAPAQP